jgi:hypothetical protein
MSSRGLKNTQPLGSHSANCTTQVFSSLRKVLIGLGHRGDQVAAWAKHLK